MRVELRIYHDEMGLCKETTMKLFVSCLSLAALMFLSGCASTGESSQRDQTTSGVGMYPPPPSSQVRARVGIPPFTATTDILGYSVTGNELELLAADQLATLMHKTYRFEVIERSQLGQLLQEQNLEGIVKDAELTRMGQVDGIDYLVLGKITNFRVKREKSDNFLNITGKAAQELLGGRAGGVSKENTKITTEVGVDIRLVNPENGKVRMAEFSEFERTDTANGFGFRYAGFGTGGDADVRLSKDDAGQVLRLAFDDAIRKALPEIDKVLREDASTLKAAAMQEAAPANVTSPGAPAVPATTTAKFCPRCGTKLPGGAKFCPTDGQAIQ